MDEEGIRPQKPCLSSEQVTLFLTDHYDDTVSDVSPLCGGEWSQAFCFRRGHLDCVARFGYHNADYLKDTFASNFRSARLPIPRILDTGEAMGAYYAISERAFGTMLNDQDTPSTIASVPSLLTTMDAIRETDITNTSGFGPWDTLYNGVFSSWRELLLAADEQLHHAKIRGWRTDLENSPFGTEVFDKAYARLVELSQDLPEDRSLVHNDLLNFNVLVDHDKITAVIDWGNAIYGDFLYDLAMFTFWSEVDPPTMGEVDWKAETMKHYRSIGLEIPEFERRLLCCMLNGGLNSLAYSAYKQYWKLFESTSRHIAHILL